MASLTSYLIYSMMLPSLICCVPDVSKEELVSLGVSCHEIMHSCTVNSPENCKCDPDCAVYRDCCYDSPHRKNMNWAKNIAQCEVRTYVVNKCPQTWDDEIFKYYCETYINITEPLSTSSVLSMRTGISYRNYYCAVCNEDTDDLQLWPIEVTCNSSNRKDINLENLRYDKELFAWGVWYRNSEKQLRFAYCNIKSVPKFENNNIRSCTPAIDKCATDWNDRLIEEKCLSYQGLIYAGKPLLAYRNAHCALCNYVDLKDIECFVIRTRTSIQHANFANIFRIDEVDSNSSKCQEEHIYDPIMNKCQSLSCLPFQKEKDGKCVPKR